MAKIIVALVTAVNNRLR